MAAALIKRGTILLLVLGVSCSTMVLCAGQRDSNGVYRTRIVVNKPDALGQALGFQNDNLDGVARRAVRSQGWMVVPSSRNTITVSIAPMVQKQEDRYDFKVEVTGSSPAIRSGEGRHKTIVAKRDVTVSWNNHSALTSAIDELVRNVASKFRERIRPSSPKDRVIR